MMLTVQNFVSNTSTDDPVREQLALLSHDYVNKAINSNTKTNKGNFRKWTPRIFIYKISPKNIPLKVSCTKILYEPPFIVAAHK